MDVAFLNTRETHFLRYLMNLKGQLDQKKAVPVVLGLDWACHKQGKTKEKEYKIYPL